MQHGYSNSTAKILIPWEKRTNLPRMRPELKHAIKSVKFVNKGLTELSDT